jgi:SAM-dependent methyltransferase
MGAVETWERELRGWAIPAEILAKAETTPWLVPRDVFVRRADRQLHQPSTPTHQAVLEQPGAVLDVGAGAGAASLPCAKTITHITAVDTDTHLLIEFAQRARELSLPHRTVNGRWPNVADQVDTVDVAVCANVLYNVTDLHPFIQALTEHTRSRVVLELTEVHPMTAMNPLWKRFHGLERPTRPTVDDAVAALRELGADLEIVRWEKKAWPMPFEDLVEVTRRRLCLGVDRADEVSDALRGTTVRTRRMVTVFWSPERSQ